ncbi:limbic system-associated membrane protein-like [Anneissia japonica]|uniref:limbic system-associated membrane protein-like n=1 Tax=Anneissia japonica TaxID=1529436 RepID=UPI0014259768|nr:limbic system-associated membrane protein-like [Anneissia japonica]
MNRYITNESRMFECKIFTDCLITDTERLNNMLEGRRGYIESWTMATFIQSLLNKGELSVKEAEYSALFVLNHTNLLTEDNGICQESPAITSHPVSELVTVVGNAVEIACQASGDPPPTFSWTFNGRILDNENLNTLHIQKVSTFDSGVYVCHASNEVTSVQSLECKLIVEYPPVITRHPGDSDIDYGNPEGVFFVCNTSSLPLADFRWFFQETLTSNLALIEGMNDTGLELLSPGFHQSGWYTCEASNKHGLMMSKPARLTILNITMPDVSSPMELTLLEIEKS